MKKYIKYYLPQKKDIAVLIIFNTGKEYKDYNFLYRQASKKRFDEIIKTLKDKKDWTSTISFTSIPKNKIHK